MPMPMPIASLQLQLQILLFILLLPLVISSSPFPTAPPPSSSFPTLPFSYSSSSTTTSVLHYLGFQLLSTAANLSSTPITIFAPSDSSLLTCPSCSLPFLLRQYSVPGLYTLRFLSNLAFGTKIETLAPNYCLTITTATNASSPHAAAAVFVNGVEITGPDLFNNGVLIIHGLDGFVSHLSTLSCDIDRTTTLSFPQPSSPHLSVMRPMLKDAILRLRVSGYGVLALALRMKFKQLSELKAMTVFALDDVSVFSGGGHATFLSDFWFHVVPNRRMMAAELVTMPPGTLLPTMEIGQNLVVTTAGGGGLLAPMKINDVRISSLDVMHNSRIVVHGLTAPLPHRMHFHSHAEEAEWSVSGCNLGGGGGMCEVEAPVPAGIRSTGYMELRHGDRDRGL